MNEQRFERRMERRLERMEKKGLCQQHNGRRWVGFFLLVVGGLFLARESGVQFPAWFFTWPMLLIGIGVLSGIRHNFHGFGWLIPILVGGFFLADKISPELRIKPYIWPMILIAFGLLFLLRPKKNNWQNSIDAASQPADVTEPMPVTPGTPQENTAGGRVINDGNEVIDATAVFGGVKKKVISKNFKGGDITTFMGGAEINLTQADFNGRVMIDCFNMFGGTKLIIPADWDVQSELVTIFGGIEDKRPPATTVNPNKVIFLDGTCIFGGVEIKSF